MLYKWKIIENPKCLDCNHVDTLEHHFFDCETTKLFWKSITDWLKDIK